MDTNKLISSGGDPPQSTYKPIPEVDGEEIPLTRPKSLVSSKGGTPEEDGADEKMLPNEEKKVSPNSNVNSGDVKFVSNEKQNGDAKLDIGDVKPSFVGMGKEELMKYANDPFWVRLRWFLFITFWLLWAGMLVGAILIIVAAPKCSPPEPRTWWQQGPLTELKSQLPTQEKLAELKKNGVEGVIVSYDSNVFDAIKNISQTFLDFMNRAKEKDVNVIVSVNPTVSLKWFEESEAKNDDFKEYYVWAPKKTTSKDGIPEPPTNWLRPDNKSAWIYSEQRTEFYLVLDGHPQLNYRNNRVVDEFTKVLTNFLDAGVKGIRLERASFLLVNDKLEDEEADKTKTAPSITDFDFYVHSKTQNQPDLGKLLKNWRNIVKKSDGDSPFFVQDELNNLQPYKFNNSLVIDLPKHSHVFSSGKNLNASLLKRNLDSAFNILEKNWPLWERSMNNIPEDVQDFITLLLPGTTVINDDHIVNEELLKLRKTSPSIMHGSCTTYTVANNTIFAFVRVAAGNPGYLIAVNPTQEKVNANFLEEIDIISEEVTVQFYSANYTEPDIEPKLKAYAKNITISPNSAIVLTYVPKSED